MHLSQLQGLCMPALADHIMQLQMSCDGCVSGSEEDNLLTPRQGALQADCHVPQTQQVCTITVCACACQPWLLHLCNCKRDCNGNWRLWGGQPADASPRRPAADCHVPQA